MNGLSYPVICRYTRYVISFVMATSVTDIKIRVPSVRALSHPHMTSLELGMLHFMRPQEPLDK